MIDQVGFLKEWKAVVYLAAGRVAAERFEADVSRLVHDAEINAHVGDVLRYDP